MRRRSASLDGDGGLPEHLRQFDEADWLPLLTPAGLVPPASWEWPVEWWRDMHARDLWRSAGKSWLAEHGGDERDWWRLTRPQASVDYEPLAAG